MFENVVSISMLSNISRVKQTLKSQNGSHYFTSFNDYRIDIATYCRYSLTAKWKHMSCFLWVKKSLFFSLQFSVVMTFNNSSKMEIKFKMCFLTSVQEQNCFVSIINSISLSILPRNISHLFAFLFWIRKTFYFISLFSHNK